MDLQLSVEEICNERLLWGDPESLRKLILPRTPSRCCSGSTRTLRSYLAKVNASRSRARAHRETHTTRATHANFIFIPTSSGAASQFQIAPRPPPPKHSAMALAPASEWKPGNRISCSPSREGLCLPRRAPEHSPFCNPLRRSSAFHAHRGPQSTVLCF